MQDCFATNPKCTPPISGTTPWRYVVSQKHQTIQKTPKAYSYTSYDVLGRIKEIGEKAENTTATAKFANIFGTFVNNKFNPDAIDDANLKAWVTDATKPTNRSNKDFL